MSIVAQGRASNVDRMHRRRRPWILRIGAVENFLVNLMGYDLPRMPNFFPTASNASSARSSCSWVWVAI